MHQSTEYVTELSIHFLHGPISALTHQTPLVLQLLFAATIAQELIQMLVYDCPAGLEIVAAFMDLALTSTATQNLQTFLEFPWYCFLKRCETHITVRIHQLLYKLWVNNGFYQAL